MSKYAVPAGLKDGQEAVRSKASTGFSRTKRQSRNKIPVDLQSLKVPGGIRTIQHVMDVVTECMDLLARAVLDEKTSKELRAWTDLLSTLAMALNGTKTQGDNVLVGLLAIANAGPTTEIDEGKVQAMLPQYQKVPEIPEKEAIPVEFNTKTG